MNLQSQNPEKNLIFWRKKNIYISFITTTKNFDFQMFGTWPFQVRKIDVLPTCEKNYKNV